ncbi:MAG: hypothetical protein C4567_07990 [Deltaproteobacteria bacterium]|nr:MAG: hypothetical protein C4567_07990 [Deltaproteobacteria bacterium]
MQESTVKGHQAVKDLLSDLGEAEFGGETYLLVGRAGNLSGVENTVSYFAAINKRAAFPAPLVIIPVFPVEEPTKEE